MRVHPRDSRPARSCPTGSAGDKFWEERFDDINAFERHLTRNGTLDPEVLPPPLEEGAEEALPGSARRPGQALEVLVRRYEGAGVLGRLSGRIQDALQQTSTPWAPWWVIPADHKFVTRALVSGITTHAIRRLNLKWPVVSAEQKRLLARARRELAAGK